MLRGVLLRSLKMLPFPLLTIAAFVLVSHALVVLGQAPEAVILLSGVFGHALWLMHHRLKPHRPVHLRGRRRPEELRLPARRTPALGETIRWGGVDLPAATATTHFLLAGTTGSGKTLLMNTLMASVIPTIGAKQSDGSPFDRRALVYDAKGDVLSLLCGMASCRVVTLHPFDARGAAWDIARDITTPAAALQAAALLVPQDRGGAGNPFFVLAAQNLVRGVLLSFIEVAAGRWTLRDVMLALRFEERLRQVLEKTSEGRAILDQFFQTGETLQGVRATLATKLAPFEVIAAAWDAAPERVSLTQFLEDEFVLVLGNDETTRTALDALNRVLFQRLTELILAQEDTRRRQTWIFLDEAREAGRLDVSRLMTKGRSKGACVTLGFQAIEGMREVYGQNVAEEITGLCNNKAILRLDSPVSARWASDLFGQCEELDHRLTRSSSRSGQGLTWTSGRGNSLSQQRLTTDAVLPSEFSTLPPTGEETGLTAFFLTRALGAYRQTLNWSEVVAAQSHRLKGFLDFAPRSAQHQYLREWSTADHERLGLSTLRMVPEPASQETRRRLRDIRSIPPPPLLTGAA